jgi:hypothetical protein
VATIEEQDHCVPMLASASLSTSSLGELRAMLAIASAVSTSWLEWNAEQHSNKRVSSEIVV